ncbi:adenosine deaminase-like protein [Argiope bruennichi]|uniref:Adenosine deaminase-like protein n=1 Tax=Argiope bruennichi TaxID=94029 RepID=A0A8T0FSY4_ARGBR|nr:adenosine deaminase-like protein [Argiope bruennichi]KAF8794211.1 Adenosine deaminase-like protein like [Argiope bruennichi]
MTMEIDLADKQMQLFIKEMPKIELHAHLNGSLSHNTLQKLIELKAKQSNAKQELNLEIPSLSSNDLSECFKVFGLIHKITDSAEAIYMATCDVIEDFYKDGICYLELRTTPKESDLIATQDIYVKTVIKAIEDTCFEKCKGLSVKLLLSIDRKRPPSCAEETLKIAEKYFTGLSPVIGIDLSGNPNTGDINYFLPYLEYAKKIGLKLAIHISEVPGNFEEVERLLKLEPNRLGHGTYLHPQKGGSTKNFELLKQLKIPLEFCLTSNVISKTVSSYEDHHLTLFREMNYPYVLCTDDKGIFNTSLSNEYYLASKYYSLSKQDLFNLSYESIDYIFSSEIKKNELKNIWKKYKSLI